MRRKCGANPSLNFALHIDDAYHQSSFYIFRHEHLFAYSLSSQLYAGIIASSSIAQSFRAKQRSLTAALSRAETAQRFRVALQRIVMHWTPPHRGWNTLHRGAAPGPARLSQRLRTPRMRGRRKTFRVRVRREQWPRAKDHCRHPRAQHRQSKGVRLPST